MTDFLGFLLPPFIDTINSRIANSQLRFWVSVLFCTVVATGLVFMETPSNDYRIFIPLIAQQALRVFGMAQLTYKAVWEKSGAREVLNLKHE